MLFTAHIVDTDPLKALRRTAPEAAQVPGLLSARVATSAPFTAGWMPKPQFGRAAMLACWQDESSADRFLGDHPVGQAFSAGWNAKLELFRAVGQFPGVPLEDISAVADANVAPTSGPSVALTIGTAYARTLLPFIRVTKNIDKQFLQAPGSIWGTAFVNLPKLMVASFTIWESPTAAEEFMRTSAHGASVRDHFDYQKDPTGHTFVTGGGFLGFRPVSVTGSLIGRNPIPTFALT